MKKHQLELESIGFIFTAIAVLGLASCATAGPASDPTAEPVYAAAKSIETASQCAEKGLAPPNAVTLGTAVNYARIASTCAQQGTNSSDVDAATAAFNAAIVYNAIAPVLKEQVHYDSALSAIQRSYAILDDRDSTLRNITGEAGRTNRLFLFGRKLEHAKALAAIGVPGTTETRAGCGTAAACATEAVTLLDAGERTHAAPIRVDHLASPASTYDDFIFLRAQARKKLVDLGRLDQGNAAILDFRDTISSARAVGNVGLADRASLGLGALSVRLGNDLLGSKSYDSAVSQFNEAVRTTLGVSGGAETQAHALFGLGRSFDGLAEIRTGPDRVNALCQASAQYQGAKTAAAGVGLSEQSLQAGAGRARSLALLSTEGLGDCPPTDPAQPQSREARRDAAIQEFSAADQLLKSVDLILFADLYQALGDTQRSAELLGRVGSEHVPGGLDVLLKQAELTADTRERIALLHRAAQNYSSSPKPHVKLGELHASAGQMPQAIAAFQNAVDRSQNTSTYGAERATAQFHLSQIKSGEAARIGASSTTEFRRLAGEAATHGEEAAQLSTEAHMRQQACRAHLLNRSSQISRTQADIRCVSGSTIEDDLLSALYKLRRGQFHKPLTDSIGAFGPAEAAFRQAQVRHGAALTQRLPAEWHTGSVSPTYAQVFEHGALIANLCSRRGGERMQPPSGDLAEREAVFKLYGLFRCQP